MDNINKQLIDSQLNLNGGFTEMQGISARLSGLATRCLEINGLASKVCTAEEGVALIEIREAIYALTVGLDDDPSRINKYICSLEDKMSNTEKSILQCRKVDVMV